MKTPNIHFSMPEGHWAVMRPMLSLMLEDETSFTQYKDHFLSAQEPQNHVKLKDALMRNSWPTSVKV
jgi:exportin-7